MKNIEDHDNTILNKAESYKEDYIRATRTEQNLYKKYATYLHGSSEYLNQADQELQKIQIEDVKNKLQAIKEYFNGQLTSTLNAISPDERNILLQGVAIVILLKKEFAHPTLPKSQYIQKAGQEKERFQQFMQSVDAKSDVYFIMKLWLEQIDQMIKNAYTALTEFARPAKIKIIPIDEALNILAEGFVLADIFELSVNLIGDITKAYRKLFFIYHPDKPTRDEEKFKIIGEAKDSLIELINTYKDDKKIREEFASESFQNTLQTIKKQKDQEKLNK